MSEPSLPFGSPSSLDLACFEVRGQLYALDITQLREIVRFVEVTPLPNAPSMIEGVVDLRGTVIPVLDLARVLGRGRTDRGSRARIVVLEVDGLIVGLLVDAATDVLTVEAGRLEDVPELASQAGYDSVRHVLRRPGGSPIMVLAVENILAGVYRSALPRGQEMGEVA
jgi:purine-binding chemotaxis protein CheW